MAQEVHDTVGAIENAAGAVNNAVHNVINVGKQIEENINLDFQPEELLPEPQDRPSLDIAALIASANRISVETIFRDQQAELAKYPTSHLKVLLQFFFRTIAVNLRHLLSIPTSRQNGIGKA